MFANESNKKLHLPILEKSVIWIELNYNINTYLPTYLCEKHKAHPCVKTCLKVKINQFQ